MNRQEDPNPNLHESQPSRPHVPEEPYRDESLAALSRAEGGGPIRRVNMDQMPKPLRYFGYAIRAIMLIGIAVIIASGYLK